MLLRIFRSNQLYIILLIPLIAFALWFENLYPQIDSTNAAENSATAMPLYEYLLAWLAAPLARNIAALVLIVAQAFLLIHINAKYRLIQAQSFLPGLLYILLTCSLLPLQKMHPAIVANFFLLLAIARIFDTYRKQNALTNFYEAAFLIGIGTLFYSTLLVFWLVVLLGIIIIRSFNWREWIVAILGFLTPLIILFSIYFLLDIEHQTIIQKIKVNLAFQSHTFKLHYLYYSYFALLGLLFIFALYNLFGLKSIKISTRKNFRILIWMAIISVALLFFGKNTGLELLFMLLVPASFFIANYFHSIRIRWWGNLLIIIILTNIILIQILV